MAAAAFLYQRNRPLTSGQLLGLLPRADAVVFFADVTAIRDSGILARLPGIKQEQDPEYTRFVSESGFNYQQDIDAIAVASQPNQTFAVLAGRFAWERLAAYAGKHGGSCKGVRCRVPASQPGRWISFLPLRKSLMAVAVSADPDAAGMLRSQGDPVADTPAFPVWMEFPRRTFETPSSSLPAVAQVAVAALSGASKVILAFDRPPGQNRSELLALHMIASYESPSAAGEAAGRLSKLKQLLAQAEKLDQKDDQLGKILAEGAIQSDGSNVTARWLLSAGFLRSIVQ